MYFHIYTSTIFLCFLIFDYILMSLLKVSNNLMLILSRFLLHNRFNRNRIALVKRKNEWLQIMKEKKNIFLLANS